MNNFTLILGSIAVFLSVSCGIPQLFKMIQTGSSDNISPTTYKMLLVAVSFYLVRAIYIHAPIFIISNALNIIISSCILRMIYKLRR